MWNVRRTCFAASLGRMNMDAEDSIATIDSIFYGEKRGKERRDQLGVASDLEGR